MLYLEHPVDERVKFGFIAPAFFAVGARVEIIAIDEYVTHHVIQERGVGAVRDGHASVTGNQRLGADAVPVVIDQGLVDAVRARQEGVPEGDLSAYSE